MLPDATVKKVSSRTSPRGDMGQTYLTSGKRVSMRLWIHEEPRTTPVTMRDYETVGYVISGKAELKIEGQIVRLEPGDSWLVPADASHSYRILEPLTAVEATAPPSQVRGRDAAQPQRTQEDLAGGSPMQKPKTIGRTRRTKRVAKSATAVNKSATSVNRTRKTAAPPSPRKRAKRRSSVLGALRGARKTPRVTLAGGAKTAAPKTSRRRASLATSNLATSKTKHAASAQQSATKRLVHTAARTPKRRTTVRSGG
jgi:mannose-6-phosphate isomerase-like protein (cupin superfamily)